jgi:hypothetical protein
MTGSGTGSFNQDARIRIADTGSSGYWVDSLGILLNEPEEAPMWVINQHLGIKKDLQCTGMLNSFEGIVGLRGGVAGWAPSTNPMIYLTHNPTLEIRSTGSGGVWTYGNLTNYNSLSYGIIENKQNMPAMNYAQFLNYMTGSGTGSFNSVGMLRMSDTGSTLNWINMFGLILTEPEEAPIFIIDHHLGVKKDLLCTGMLERFEGIVALRGDVAGWAPSVNPMIYLTNPGTSTTLDVRYNDGSWKFGNIRANVISGSSFQGIPNTGTGSDVEFNSVLARSTTAALKAGNGSNMVAIVHSGSQGYIASLAGDLKLSAQSGLVETSGDLSVKGDLYASGSTNFITQKGSTSTDANGDKTVTFSTAFGSTPLVFVQAVDASARGIIIDVVSKSTSNFVVKARSASAIGSHKHLIGNIGAQADFTMSVANESAHTHSSVGTSGVDNADHTHTAVGTSGVQSADHTHSSVGNTGVQSADHAHSLSGETGTPTSTTQHGTANFTSCASGHSYCKASGTSTWYCPSTSHTHYYSAWTSGVNTDHSHSYANTTSGVSADHSHYYATTTSGRSATHAHSYANTTSAGSAHSHTLTNKPTYLRGISFVDNTEGFYNCGGTMSESTGVSTNLYTQSSGSATSNYVAVNFDWMAIPV